MNRTKKMHELKLLDNVTKSLPIGNEEQETNETNNGEENRKRITLILNECHVPEELEQRTLQAMAAMRDVQAQEAARVKAQKEVQKAVLRESHQFNKKTLFRGVAIAAVLTIMVTVTPLRNLVASAAESVYHAFHSADQDAIAMNMGTSFNGCKINAIGARLSNECLYLTLNEDYSEYANKFLQSNKALSAEQLQISINYTGSISDSKGQSVAFTNKSMLLLDSAAADEESLDGYSNIRQYKIYLPGLKDIINSEKKDYILTIACAPQISINGGKPTIDNASSGSFSRDLGIDYIDSVLSTKVFDLDESYTVGDIKFDFQKLYVGPTESSFVAELLPTGNLSKADLAGITNAQCLIAQASPEGMEQDRERYYNSLDGSNEENQRAAFETPAFYSENYFTTFSPDDITPSLFVCDSRYYMLVTCRNSGGETRYNYQDMLEAVEQNQFRIFCLSYCLNKGVIAGDTLYSYSEQPYMHLGVVPTDISHQWDDVTYQKIPTQTVSLGKRQKNDSTFSYSVDKEFAAGDVHFHLQKITYDYEASDVIRSIDPSVKYQASGIKFIIDDIYIPGSKRKPYFRQAPDPNEFGDYMMTEMVLVGEKNGTTATITWNADWYGDISQKGDVLSTGFVADWGVPDKLTLGYIRYYVPEYLDDDYTILDKDTIYYDPAYFTPESIREHHEILTHTHDNTLFTIG